MQPLDTTGHSATSKHSDTQHDHGDHGNHGGDGGDHGHGDGDHDHGHGHDEHHEPGWIQKYVFSTDHKMIGIQYGFTALVFLFIGFVLMLMMRWQIANPGVSMPYFGEIAAAIFGRNFMPDGVMQPDFYNSLGAMHGTIMVFLAIVPLAFGAFGNYVVPLKIGAPDMSFPKLNMASYWSYFVGGLIMFGSFFFPGGAAKSGWTAYPPLAGISDAPGTQIVDPTTGLKIAEVLPFFNGQTLWLVGMVFLISSSLLGSVNFITTIVQLRAKGMTWMRLPFFCWAQLVTAFLLLLAFPPLEAAAVMQLMDRLAETSFFMPAGLVVGGNVLEGYSGGGSPLLYQHLFWFLGHPEVYVLILPAIGIVSEIIANNSRKPLWGYRTMVGAAVVLGFLSFFVWAHHMYLTGMGTTVSMFFQTTTMLISIPSVILLTALIISLWGGSIRFTVPMLFATAFIPMFGIGGLTGLPLAFNLTDLHLHDTYYVIGHFHYVVAPGTMFGLFAGIYYWYPKITGRQMNTFLGHAHFWPSLILMNGIFMPMFIQGMAGMHRRWYDGGSSWELAQNYLWMNDLMSNSAFLLALAQIPFIINLFMSAKFGKKVGDNPWNSTTLEWATPTPPPHGNFVGPIAVYRGPYEYSVPGHDTDFYPQWEKPKDEPAATEKAMEQSAVEHGTAPAKH